MAASSQTFGISGLKDWAVVDAVARMSRAASCRGVITKGIAEMRGGIAHFIRCSLDRSRDLDRDPEDLGPGRVSMPRQVELALFGAKSREIVERRGEEAGETQRSPAPIKAMLHWILLSNRSSAVWRISSKRCSRSRRASGVE